MNRITPVTRDLLRSMPVPVPAQGSKDDRGQVLVVAGSVEVPGAAVLSGTAALRAGAGKLQIATVRSVAAQMAVAVPEALIIGLAETPDGGIDHRHAMERLLPRLERCNAVLIGPGMTQETSTAAIVPVLLATALPFVLDAAALYGLQSRVHEIRSSKAGLVLTPHAGEMAQLLDLPRNDIEANPLAAAQRAARMFDAVIVMKGADTHIVDPDGNAWCYDRGTIGLATSGSGDVLAGLITGLLARGAGQLQAALLGVYLHGEAGSHLARSCGPLGFLARELSIRVPGILGELYDALSPGR